MSNLLLRAQISKKLRKGSALPPATPTFSPPLPFSTLLSPLHNPFILFFLQVTLLLFFFHSFGYPSPLDYYIFFFAIWLSP